MKITHKTFSMTNLHKPVLKSAKTKAHNNYSKNMQSPKKYDSRQISTDASKLFPLCLLKNQLLSLLILDLKKYYKSIWQGVGVSTG